MYCYSEDDRITDLVRYPESSPNPESVKECMCEYRYPRDECNMIVVLVWIFMSMVAMSMVVLVGSQHLFYDIYEEKSCDKCIDSKLGLFECFWKYVYQRDCEHRSCSESDEEIEDGLIYLLEEVEEESCRRYKREENYRDEHRSVELEKE